MFRSPKLREDAIHSRNPKKSVIGQAQDSGKSFSPLKACSSCTPPDF